ncbi:hypothetical protein COY52_01650 [Candidatus Desantisbacteria bacterium CG_4_10_14_0_8_um_filter_48_22]|uniref:Phage-Barnase-EndoU-ColicinE5/D-RelE like nuclease 2 domain-containing protein n=1 Tax=Candidatus Desantisbacteria bacterium CG_4_10_14_0_8_um_filter_48_22 TaxID=1974543 RepID=A0A2M7SFE9_9BACT|nr:MAG: hypothetical protein AUJ67_04625 [Candidatus Desantisbacteria bacterium CG1_02_49_89]PIV57363.1 MAG: hypothetical protein COS16_00695 [Candidatus Desantisbacteria bacterium CG02_land_8_20_14_3_00_49_13]PIZ18013.1 MAG: hypothetical protein COY52_01650 [Candidatus Desantisbacteria bacterium CG_4_10_14_0_8_um_filter_48_22]
MDVVKSKNNVTVRLTEERWFHIIENHDDLAGYYEDVLKTVEEPDCIIEGYGGALIALTQMLKNKFLAVVYKESENNGLIITAYFTSRIKIEKEVIIWQKQ